MSNPVKFYIDLDLHERHSQESINLIQGDLDYQIIVSLSEDGSPYVLTDDIIAFFMAIKPDGTRIFDYAEVDTDENVIIFTPPSNQLTAAEGKVRCSLVISSGVEAINSYGVEAIILATSTDQITLSRGVWAEDIEGKSIIIKDTDGSICTRDVVYRLDNYRITVNEAVDIENYARAYPLGRIKGTPNFSIMVGEKAYEYDTILSDDEFAALDYYISTLRDNLSEEISTLQDDVSALQGAYANNLVHRDGNEVIYGVKEFGGCRTRWYYNTNLTTNFEAQISFNHLHVNRAAIDLVDNYRHIAAALTSMGEILIVKRDNSDHLVGVTNYEFPYDEDREEDQETVTHTVATAADVSEAVSAEATLRGNADTTLQNNINAEATLRGNADTTLQNNINAEALLRSGADTSLQGSIDNLSTSKLNVRPDGTNLLIDSSTNKLNVSYFPDSILGQLVFGGVINAYVESAGTVVSLTAAITDAAKSILGVTSDTYSLYPSSSPDCNVEECNQMFFIFGCQDNISFDSRDLNNGDWLLSLGQSWGKVDNTDAVASVNGKTGAVVLATSDLNNDSGYITKSKVTITLPAASWDSTNKTITVNATGVTASNDLTWSPAISSVEDAASAKLYCSAQGSGTLTFICDVVPLYDITVNVLVFN